MGQSRSISFLPFHKLFLTIFFHSNNNNYYYYYYFFNYLLLPSLLTVMYLDTPLLQLLNLIFLQRDIGMGTCTGAITLMMAGEPGMYLKGIIIPLPM